MSYFRKNFKGKVRIQVRHVMRTSRKMRNLISGGTRTQRKAKGICAI